MQDIEIYIREPVMRRVLGWLKSELGEIEEVSSAKGGKIRRYKAIDQTPVIPILIHQQVEGSPYTGIWFNSAHTPWATDADCARAAFGAFDLPVQCDPGPDATGQDDFLRIDADGERIVELKDGELGHQ